MTNTHTNLNELFTDIADAIRDKTGSNETIVADNFPSEIQNIQVGVDTSDATATASDIASGKTAYVNGEKIIGSMAKSNVEMFITDVYISSKNITSLTIANAFPTDAEGTIYVNGYFYINNTRYTIYRNRYHTGDASTGGNEPMFTLTKDGNNLVLSNYWGLKFEVGFTNTMQFIKEINV